MRLAVMGSAAFAIPALHALREAGHEIVAAYSQAPRPAGRGQKPRPAPLHQAAAALGIPVRTPISLRDSAEQAAFAALALDAAVVASYGLILPPAVLAAPRRGCLNIHASLLPRWRGAAPIQAAILAGDRETGVTIMQMEAGLDTGPILLQEAVPIGPETDAPALHDTLAALGARLLLRALAENPRPQPQPPGATYAAKLRREDGHIDWRRPAEAIGRQIRALNPWPGTFTTLTGATLAGTEAPATTLKILAATIDARAALAPPGTVIDAELGIACGEGVLRPLRVQWPGRSALAVAEFLRGHPIAPGRRFA
jgi:methionyl-tRNA formyltransferase